MSTVAGDLRGFATRPSWREGVRQWKTVFLRSVVLGVAILSEMPFLEHLEELRSRILKSLIAEAITTSICVAYAANLIRFLSRPAADQGIQLIAYEATEVFSLYFRVALAAGICLAAPFILYQIWRFIEPALHSHEKRYAAPFLISTTLCFIVGVTFGYAVVAPWLMNLQASLALQTGVIKYTPSALSYFGLLTATVVAMGAVFQMPPIVFILSRIGLVNAGFLLRNFKYAFLVFSIASAVLTPSSDLPPMLAFMAVMTAIYGVSILVAWTFGRSRKLA